MTLGNTTDVEACILCDINPRERTSSLFCVSCSDEFPGRFVVVDTTTSEDSEKPDDVKAEAKPEAEPDYEPGAQDDGPLDLDGYYECNCSDCQS